MDPITLGLVIIAFYVYPLWDGMKRVNAYEDYLTGYYKQCGKIYQTDQDFWFTSAYLVCAIVPGLNIVLWITRFYK